MLENFPFLLKYLWNIFYLEDGRIDFLFDLSFCHVTIRRANSNGEDIQETFGMDGI